MDICIEFSSSTAFEVYRSDMGLVISSVVSPFTSDHTNVVVDDAILTKMSLPSNFSANWEFQG